MTLRKLEEKDFLSFDKTTLIDIACVKWKELENKGIYLCKEVQK